MTTASAGAPRRQLATRDAAWAQGLARALANAGIQPNTVSLAGVSCALAACLALFASSRIPGDARAVVLMVGAAAIQLRLLCNLLDGMLAVEQGLKSRTGDIFNDLPDRLADVLILAGAGYAVPGATFGPALGWAVAAAAVLTAYVRVLAGSLGLTQSFAGPMAKQHRMFVLTVATLITAAEAHAGLPARAMAAGLVAIGTGSLATMIRRTRRILLEAAAS